MQVVHPVCCGIDVHSAQLMACLRRISQDGQITTEVVEYGTTYSELDYLIKYPATFHLPS